MESYKPLINHSGFFYHDDIEHAGHKTHSHSLQNHSHATLSTAVHKHVHNENRHTKSKTRRIYASISQTLIANNKAY